MRHYTFTQTATCASSTETTIKTSLSDAYILTWVKDALRDSCHKVAQMGHKNPYKSKVFFRYQLSQAPRTSWYSQDQDQDIWQDQEVLTRPGGLDKTRRSWQDKEVLTRPGGLDKTMITSKTKSSGKAKINHGTILQCQCQSLYKNESSCTLHD